MQRGQRLHLVLLSPLVNLLLALTRAALLVLLVLRLVPWNLPRVPLARGSAAAVLLLVALWPATSRADPRSVPGARSGARPWARAKQGCQQRPACA